MYLHRMASFKENTMVVTRDESKQACKLLNEITCNISAVTEIVNKLTDEIKNGEFDTKKGLSFLDLKNHSFVSYISDLAFTKLHKLLGQSLQNQPVIDRLIEQRIVIERLGPYENKLKHQIEKYLKADLEAPVAGVAAEASANTGLSVEDFASGETDAEDEEQTDDEGGAVKDAPARAYRVPKVSQNKFPDAEADEERAAAARRRLAHSRTMQDALYEHNTDPDVIHHASNLQRRALQRREEITRFEEENFRRVRLSKKDRVALRATSTAGAMHGELLGFSDVSAVTGGGERPSKRRKTMPSGGNKKGKGKGKGKKGGKKRH